MTDTSERIARDFFLRDPEEQKAFLENTWCNQCQQMDLGMTDPVEYEFMGRVFIEGKCLISGEPSITEVVDDEDDSE